MFKPFPTFNATRAAALKYARAVSWALFDCARSMLKCCSTVSSDNRPKPLPQALKPGSMVLAHHNHGKSHALEIPCCLRRQESAARWKAHLRALIFGKQGIQVQKHVPSQGTLASIFQRHVPREAWCNAACADEVQ